MNKHTPGPWEIVKLDHGIVVRTESLNKTKYGASRYACIGGFDRADPEQLAEAIANAQLIAAAPELLEVLEELKSCSDYWSEYDVPLGIVDRINNVIAKAKGEA